MPAYLLRSATSKRFIGLYAADNERDLSFLIDEETDPGDYEYAVFPSGYGIQFRKADHAPVRCRIGSGRRGPGPSFRMVDYVYMTSALLDVLSDGDDDLTWIALAEGSTRDLDGGGLATPIRPSIDGAERRFKVRREAPEHEASWSFQANGQHRRHDWWVYRRT